MQCKNNLDWQDLRPGKGTRVARQVFTPKRFQRNTSASCHIMPGRPEDFPQALDSIAFTGSKRAFSAAASPAKEAESAEVQVHQEVESSPP